MKNPPLPKDNSVLKPWLDLTAHDLGSIPCKEPGQFYRVPGQCWVLYLYKGRVEMGVSVPQDLRAFWVLSSFTQSTGDALCRVVIVQTHVYH